MPALFVIRAWHLCWQLRAPLWNAITFADLQVRRSRGSAAVRQLSWRWLSLLAGHTDTGSNSSFSQDQVRCRLLCTTS